MQYMNSASRIVEFHGVSDNEVGKSVGDVVDAIHECPELDIQFPNTFSAQTKLMLGLRQSLN
jgi:hypothetical protein